MADSGEIVQSAEAIGSNLPGVSTSALADMVFGLALVILVIFVCAWLYKRFGGLDGGVSNAIKVVAALSLGSRDRLALVEVGSKKILLGISPGRINTLHVFDGNSDDESNFEEAGQLSQASESMENNSVKNEFAKKLQSLLGPKNITDKGRES
ncbi:MAG: flagellar biosynthetic protein FliO [SAR86 cluster bacterium]|uniref:Flagellar protein n=1 Tax=SAR86 cluster bacterium TaxID=2030880 RepID=A0A2A4MJB8_9GAMM|nr:MAG: flagellar biosynthetic protein FliO [SAR86 cluster bacterium]